MGSNCSTTQETEKDGIIAGLSGYKGPPLQQFAPLVMDGDIMFKNYQSGKKMRVRHAFLLSSAIVLTERRASTYKFESLCAFEPTMETEPLELTRMQNFRFHGALRLAQRWCTSLQPKRCR